MEYSQLILGVFNKLLDDLKGNKNIPRGLPTETELAKQYSVSRSTVRKVIEILYNKSIARKDGQNKILLRLPKKADYFSVREIKNSKSDLAERSILKKLYDYDLKPGTRFSELELAKEFKMNTVTVREALLNISQTGLIKKRPGQKWEVEALTQKNITELMQFRVLLEQYALNCYKNSSSNAENRRDLEQLLTKHQNIKQRQKIDVGDFVNLEKQFHYTLIKTCQNKFIEESYHALFLLIRYHIGQITYDLNKIKKVLDQHIHILKALLSENFELANQALDTHLRHAERSIKEVNFQERKSK